MPAKGTTKVSEKQKSLIVKRRMQGATNTQIAAETGMHPVTVSLAWNSPESQAIVARARYECAPEIRNLYRQVIDTLVEDLAGSKSVTERMRLRDEALSIMARGEPVAAQAAAQNEGNGEYTLQELLLRVSRATMPAGTTGVSIHPPPLPPTAGNGTNGHHS